MMIGIVKLESFKRMASTIKKRVEGCKHGHALEKLARACGMRSYNHLLEFHCQGLSMSQLMQGSQDDLLRAWSNRLSEYFARRCERLEGGRQ